MASFNKVILMGNLTRDPEMKYLPSGTAVTNFAIAMSDRYTDRQTGEQKENVCFVDLEAWDRQAEIVNEYLSKGSPVFIEGSLRYDSWEAEDGTKRSRLKVRVFRVQLIGGRRDGDEAGSYPDNASSGTPMEQSGGQTSSPSEGGNDSSTEDDIPF
ncbi:single-stranded DNA-binding protein [Candidatus Poribacteria bacterium]|nr:MAG: single-stranded DNA-binding protein [Candidatus Poribacteria bacterium]